MSVVQSLSSLHCAFELHSGVTHIPVPVLQTCPLTQAASAQLLQVSPGSIILLPQIALQLLSLFALHT